MIRTRSATARSAPYLLRTVPRAGLPRQHGRLAAAGAATRSAGGLVVALAAAAGLTGCINVTAPDQPIVIELNINIRQEVVYRLAADAANTINENADIF